MTWTAAEDAQLMESIRKVEAGEAIWPFERFMLWTALERFGYDQIELRLAELLDERERLR